MNLRVENPPHTNQELIWFRESQVFDIFMFFSFSWAVSHNPESNTDPLKHQKRIFEIGLKAQDPSHLVDLVKLRPLRFFIFKKESQKVDLLTIKEVCVGLGVV